MVNNETFCTNCARRADQCRCLTQPNRADGDAWCVDCGEYPDECDCDKPRAETPRADRYAADIDISVVLADLGLEPAGREICTCGIDAPNYGAHRPDCDLVFNGDFELGLAYWDRELKYLIELPDDARDLLNANDQLTPREVLLDLAEHVADVLDSGERDDSAAYAKWWEDKDSTSYDYGYGTGWDYQAWHGCDHTQDAFTLPTGPVVYASSLHGRKAGEVIPDFAVYLDGGWRPDCPAYHIGCPDRGVPIMGVKKVIGIAREVLARVTQGEHVEIGCIGGHGRTGLFLATLTAVDIYAQGGSILGPKVVDYVRLMHCKDAIESREQEWFIACVVAELRGEQYPAKPQPPKPLPIKKSYNPGPILDKCKECGHVTDHDSRIACVASQRVETHRADGTVVVTWHPCGCKVGQEKKIDNAAKVTEQAYKSNKENFNKRQEQNRKSKKNKSNRGGGTRGAYNNQQRGGNRWR